MSKISIKKNIGPTKIAKSVYGRSPKQKQKQTQKQSVVVNIGTTKGRRPTSKRKSPVKQKLQSQQPVAKGVYGQSPIVVAPTFAPIFNKPNIGQNQNPFAFQNPVAQLIAQQEKPKVLKEEFLEQSTIAKALSEQNTQTDETVVRANDLERVRAKRLEKLDKPRAATTDEDESKALSDLARLTLLYRESENPLAHTARVIKTEEPIKSGLLSQVASEPQIAAYGQSPIGVYGQSPNKYSSALASLGFSFPASQKKAGSIIDVLEKETKEEIDIATLENIQDELLKAQEIRRRRRGRLQPLQPLQGQAPPTTAETFGETVIGQSPIVLNQPEPELGFGGLTEEVQTSVGQGEFLPPAPVSQDELLRREQQEPPPSILEVRPPDAVITERLVKEDIGPIEPPEAEARVLETRTESQQIREKWQQLVDSGQLQAGTKKEIGSSSNKNKKELLADIRTVEPEYTPVKSDVKRTGKGTPKKAFAEIEV
jgi:hypothetical protein